VRCKPACGFGFAQDKHRTHLVKLSGASGRGLMLALAALARQTLLILDEPTTSLYLRAQRTV